MSHAKEALLQYYPWALKHGIITKPNKKDRASYKIISRCSFCMWAHKVASKSIIVRHSTKTMFGGSHQQPYVVKREGENMQKTLCKNIYEIGLRDS